MKDPNKEEKKNAKKKHPRFFRALLTAACALLFVCVACGVGYAYYLGTTDTIKNPFDVSQRIYTQKLQVRYENADGSFTAYQTLLDRKFKYGDASEWKWGGHPQDGTYQYSAPITFADDEDKTMQVSILRRRVTFDFNAVFNYQGLIDPGPSYQGTVYTDITGSWGYYPSLDCTPRNIAGFDFYINGQKVKTVTQGDTSMDFTVPNVRVGSTYEFRNFHYYHPEDFPDSLPSSEVYDTAVNTRHNEWGKGTVTTSRLYGNGLVPSGYCHESSGGATPSDEEFFAVNAEFIGRKIYIDVNCTVDGAWQSTFNWMTYSLYVRDQKVASAGDYYAAQRAGELIYINDIPWNYTVGETRYNYSRISGITYNQSTILYTSTQSDGNGNPAFGINVSFYQTWHHVAYARWQDAGGNWSAYSAFFDSWGQNGEQTTGYADGNTYNNPTQTVTFGADSSARYIDFSRKTYQYSSTYRVYQGWPTFEYNTTVNPPTNKAFYNSDYDSGNWAGPYTSYSGVHYVGDGWNGNWYLHPDNHQEQIQWNGKYSDFEYDTSAGYVDVYWVSSGAVSRVPLNLPRWCYVHIIIPSGGKDTADHTFTWNNQHFVENGGATVVGVWFSTSGITYST